MPNSCTVHRRLAGFCSCTVAVPNVADCGEGLTPNSVTVRDAVLKHLTLCILRASWPLKAESTTKNQRPNPYTQDPFWYIIVVLSSGRNMIFKIKNSLLQKTKLPM